MYFVPLSALVQSPKICCSWLPQSTMRCHVMCAHVMCPAMVTLCVRSGSVTMWWSKVLFCTTKYYCVLQSTTPVLLCTTKYYSVLLQYYFLLKRWPNGEVNEIRTRYERDPMIPKYKMLKDILLEELLDSKIARASLPRIPHVHALKWMLW